MEGNYGQIEDDFVLFFFHQVAHGSLIGHIQPENHQVRAQGNSINEVLLFSQEKIVHYANLFRVFLNDAVYQMAADETGTAGNELFLFLKTFID